MNSKMLVKIGLIIITLFVFTRQDIHFAEGKNIVVQNQDPIQYDDQTFFRMTNESNNVIINITISNEYKCVGCIDENYLTFLLMFLLLTISIIMLFLIIMDSMLQKLLNSRPKFIITKRIQV